MKNNVNLVTLITFLISVFWFGCQEEPLSPDADALMIQPSISSAPGDFAFAPDCKETAVADLYAAAGQNDLEKGVDVGDVFLYSENGQIIVTYSLDEGSNWYLKEAHLWISASPADKKSFPKNAAPGKFPFKKEFSESDKKSHTFIIDPEDINNPSNVDLSDPCGAELFLATHAVVNEVINPTPYYASSIVESTQGLKKDGTAVSEERSNPEQGMVYETDRNPRNFFSLGFGGEIIMEFDCPIVNGEGNDVRIIEDTWGTYPEEKAEVWASADGEDWTLLGVADNSERDPVFNIHTIAEFDLGELGEARYIKVVDVSDPEVHNNAADGYDLNAVESLQDCTQDETAWGYNDNECTATFDEKRISKKWGWVFCGKICCPCDNPVAKWTDFSSWTPYDLGPGEIALCDNKTVTIEITGKTTPYIQTDGTTVKAPFFQNEHSIFNVKDIDYVRFRTRAASAEGNFNNAAPNEYTVTWEFDEPLDHSNFFVVGQLLQGNVATITAYDGTTVVNNDLAFEQIKAVKSTYTFNEPLSWTASTGELKKSTTTGSNSQYGFFSIPEGTEISKIVIELNDDGSRGRIADEVNYGIGCISCQ